MVHVHCVYIMQLNIVHHDRCIRSGHSKGYSVNVWRRMSHFGLYVAVCCKRSAYVLHKLWVRCNKLACVVLRRVRPKILHAQNFKRTDNALLIS